MIRSQAVRWKLKTSKGQVQRVRSAGSVLSQVSVWFTKHNPGYLSWTPFHPQSTKPAEKRAGRPQAKLSAAEVIARQSEKKCGLLDHSHQLTGNSEQSLCSTARNLCYEYRKFNLLSGCRQQWFTFTTRQIISTHLLTARVPDVRRQWCFKSNSHTFFPPQEFCHTTPVDDQLQLLRVYWTDLS